MRAPRVSHVQPHPRRPRQRARAAVACRGWRARAAPVSRRGRPRGGQFAHPTQRGVELRPQFDVQLAGRGDDVRALACPRGMDLTVELQRVTSSVAAAAGNGRG